MSVRLQLTSTVEQVQQEAVEYAVLGTSSSRDKQKTNMIAVAEWIVAVAGVCKMLLSQVMF